MTDLEKHKLNCCWFLSPQKSPREWQMYILTHDQECHTFQSLSVVITTHLLPREHSVLQPCPQRRAHLVILLNTASKERMSDEVGSKAKKWKLLALKWNLNHKCSYGRKAACRNDIAFWKILDMQPEDYSENELVKTNV